MVRAARDPAALSAAAQSGEEATGVDAALERALSRRSANLSRRSFLSGMMRKLITLAGVPIAAQVFPYFARTAQANTLCGLHGYWCGFGTCTQAGTQPANAWVQCCDVSSCPVSYRCCTYRDYCGQRPAGWGNGTCLGQPPSGSEWCGGTDGDYVCTTVNCSATSYSTLASCTLNCGGAQCH
jgi:hypothetical protein